MIDFLTALVQNDLVAQATVLTILSIALIMFIKDRWRYDVVAILVMVSVVLAGILPYDQALANFGHPAVIIVASMFIMSRALIQSGIVDSIIGQMTFLHTRPILALSILVILVATISAFVNNVGALAMVMPIAIHLAQKSNTPIALFLLPLAFASHLGGFMTLIGTPRNIIISNFREQEIGVGFQMFDFFYVGGGIAIAGVLFLILIAWRFIPIRQTDTTPIAHARIFSTSVIIPAESRITKLTIAKITKATKNSVAIPLLFRDNVQIACAGDTIFSAGDEVLLQGTAEALTSFVEKYKLKLSGLRSQEWHITSEDEFATTEAVVTPYSMLNGRSWNTLTLQTRFGTNFIGFSRRGYMIDRQLEQVKLWPGDILLLQGRTESVQQTVDQLGLLPVGSTEIALGRTRTIIGTATIVVGAILLASFNIIPLAFIFLVAAVFLIMFDLISLKQAYNSIDPAILILLAGMITLGDAMQASGAADTLANFLLSINGFVTPVLMLYLVLLVTMLLSDFMNTTASAVVMAPIAILVANGLNVSIDTFLMIVAIGASCAFLTPVGHESNAVVMKKGGYKFNDYFRVGFPLEIIIVLLTVPLALHFWPL
jgi:di/tricarboxylate transporter